MLRLGITLWTSHPTTPTLFAHPCCAAEADVALTLPTMDNHKNVVLHSYEEVRSFVTSRLCGAFETVLTRGIRQVANGKLCKGTLYRRIKGRFSKSWKKRYMQLNENSVWCFKNKEDRNMPEVIAVVCAVRVRVVSCVGAFFVEGTYVSASLVACEPTGQLADN